MRTSCDFWFGLWDVAAAGDADLSANTNMPFANVADINTEENILQCPDVATLEPNFGWLLDGSKEALPDNAQDYKWGWWSEEMSGLDCTFTNPPVLRITFMDDDGELTIHSSVGITLVFKGTLPAAVDISWYDINGNLLEQADYEPDTMYYFCERQVENYAKVVIRIPGMSWPYRYLRVVGLIFGALTDFDSASVITATATEEISPVSLTLPVKKLELSVYTPDGKFALLNPAGAYQYFQYRQKLTAYKTIDGDRRFAGEYYLQEASGTVDAATKLVCQDIIGVMDGIDYDGGLYDNIPLPDLLADILTPEGIAVEIDPALAVTSLTGWLPICSKRQALQQIAFAVGAMILGGEGRKLCFYPLTQVISSQIGAARKICGHKVILQDLITQVDVTAYQYVLGDSAQLVKSTLAVGEHKLTFGSPAIVGGVTGAELLEKHDNFCIVRVDTAGEVIVTGRTYEAVETICSAKLPFVPAGCSAKIQSVSSVTLINQEQAAAAAQRLLKYYQLRYTDEGQIMPGWEAVGDVVGLSSLGGRDIVGYIERMVTDLSGGGLQTVKLVGIVQKN